MKNIISELVSIENKARDIALTVKEEEDKYHQRLAAAKIKIDEEINAKVSEHAKLTDEDALRDARNRLTLTKEEYEIQYKRVGETYEKTHKQLEDAMFNRIIDA